MSIAFVGYTDRHVVSKALDFDANAFLVDNKNIDSVIKNADKDIVYYTSIADVRDANIFYKLLLSANEIYYYPGLINSDLKQIPKDKKEFFTNEANLTEYILFVINTNKRNVHGYTVQQEFTNSELTKLVDSRKPEEGNQLWISGCSIADGEATDKDKRFGHVLGQKLNIPVNWLTESGSSISWQSDQICRSDIRSGDIVVWAITHPQRYTLWNEKANTWQHVTRDSKEYDYDGIGVGERTISEMWVNKTQYYLSINAVHRAVKFCNAVDAKLMIFAVLPTQELDYELATLKEYKLYTHKNQLIFYKFLDFGTDNMHPGPLQHRAYANFCLENLRQLKYI